MKMYMSGIFLLLSLTFFTGQVFSGPPGVFDNPPSKEQMERTRKRVETLKMWKLTKILDLDEQKASKFFPVLNEYDKKRLTVAREMRKNMKKLRASADTANPDELRNIIRRVEDNHRRLQGIDNEEMKRLRDILTARDLAKFIIFKQDFDREMKKIIATVRKRRIRKYRGGGESQGYKRSAPSDISDLPSYK
ncbi:MAG: hypothetical protein L0956_01460 [Candidatus Mariimomonas ferrooxydans]